MPTQPTQPTQIGVLAINLSPVPSQVVNVTLNNQNCELWVFQKTYGLFVSITVNNQKQVASKLVRHGVNIMAGMAHGFVGGLVFVDMQGDSDPSYDGLGTRFKLFYVGLEKV